MTYDALHHAMRDGSADALAQVLLTEIACGRLHAPALRHPLGFICIKLVRDANRGACVHVWDNAFPRSAPTTSEIHSHSWDLLSRVLYGSVRNNVFEVAVAEADATHRVAEIHSRGHVDRISPTARAVTATEGTSELHPHGATYRLEAGRFHTTVVEGSAATLALGEGVPGLTDLSLIALSGPTLSTHTVTRELCDRSLTRRVARQVLQHLRDASCPGGDRVAHHRPHHAANDSCRAEPSR